MVRKFRFFSYLFIYILFVSLYSLNFKGDLTLVNIKLCLTYSILPALVGGTVTSKFLK
ncbi:hypothetical protein [Romboutsia lituseburensis]|uniref:Uncharacterized protein n=1 Tax=Romboutsia lituseburensis DSM 797 TaxID=1121325 RepID=A0A1G9SKD7_9FIRM|nr:hypothetical protein [Romboutsia lituseburensis]CEH32953.1 Hypothetical protein RLITU_0343 [Romboutsia lituseburensis]SDM35954.1 hypothetical protein SAMN04515677_1104 [Romboutsia lituseburensis DSM 797]